MSQFYVGMDLHTSNLQICIMDQDGKAILEKKVLSGFISAETMSK